MSSQQALQTVCSVDKGISLVFSSFQPRRHNNLQRQSQPKSATRQAGIQPGRAGQHISCVGSCVQPWPPTTIPTLLVKWTQSKLSTAISKAETCRCKHICLKPHWVLPSPLACLEATGRRQAACCPSDSGRALTKGPRPRYVGNDAGV